MTAVDRLAAIIAEHEWRPQSTAWYEPYGACGCGHNTAQDGDWKPYDVGCWAAHLAAVIASADDLAVIELPKPDGDYWQAGPFEVTTSVGGEVIVDHEYWLSPGDATAGCAGILAAVKAAEAVDRGEQ